MNPLLLGLALAAPLAAPPDYFGPEDAFAAEFRGDRRGLRQRGGGGQDRVADRLLRTHRRRHHRRCPNGTGRSADRRTCRP